MARLIYLFVILFTALVLAGVPATADEAKPDEAVTLPKNAKIIRVQIPDYTYVGCDKTNCYILTGANRQAILIDPADQLEAIDGTKLLVDNTTGIRMQVTTQELARYTVIATDAYGRPTTVADHDTGKPYLVYDQFRTTGAYAPLILKALTDNHLKLKLIVVTHGHLDHFAGLTYLQEKTGAKVLMHSGDLRGLDDARLTDPITAKHPGYPKDSYRIQGLHTPVTRVLADGDLITLDGMTLQVIHTPGHSPGSICLRTWKDGQPILFSGDTLLHWGYLYDTNWNYLLDKDGNRMTSDTGRTNFLDGSGDEALLYRMIREKLFTLPDATEVYPGHGDATTIQEEKQYSPARFIPQEDKPKE